MVTDPHVSVKKYPFFGLEEILRPFELVEGDTTARKGVIVVDGAQMRRVKNGKTQSLKERASIVSALEYSALYDDSHCTCPGTIRYVCVLGFFVKPVPFASSLSTL